MERCKNIHIIESIEIYFYVDASGSFVIEYNFHEKDFHLWEENVDNCSLYNVFDEVIKNGGEYYNLKAKSKDPNLYRNISLIMYSEGIDNSKEMLKMNT
jgi:hypothetical protein